MDTYNFCKLPILGQLALIQWSDGQHCDNGRYAWERLSTALQLRSFLRLRAPFSFPRLSLIGWYKSTTGSLPEPYGHHSRWGFTQSNAAVCWIAVVRAPAVPVLHISYWGFGPHLAEVSRWFSFCPAIPPLLIPFPCLMLQFPNQIPKP